MPLAIFDLDKTLIGGDSDFLWGEFLCEIGAVDDDYQAKNQHFFSQYAVGKLNINDYLTFCLKPLSRYSIDTLRQWHQQFMTKKIKPILLPKAQKMVDFHRAKNDTLLVITATNRFITEPIAAQYGITNLLATELETKHNNYTGNIIGEPCFQQGKINHLNAWLAKNSENIKNASFYSDSANDLPLLETVDNPIAVNPDKTLKKIATDKGWQILNWL